MKYGLIFLVFILPSLLKSQYSWQNSEYEHIVQQGINKLYSYEFDEAISLLDSVRIIDKSHPVPPFVLISAKWLKAQVEKGYDTSYQVIISQQNRVANGGYLNE